MGALIILLILLSPLLIKDSFVKLFFLLISIFISIIIIIIATRIDADIAISGVCLTSFAICTCALFFAQKECKRQEEEQAKIKEKKRIEKEMAREERERAEMERDAELEGLYGKLTKSVADKEHRYYDEIRVYNDTNTILLKSKPYKFSDILKNELIDNKSSKGGEMKAVTKTSNSSVLGRSAIGAVVAGPAGAIIGGGSAKKETIITQKTGKTIHSYKINVIVNCIEEPLVSLYYGSNEDMANEALAVLSVICQNKQ